MGSMIDSLREENMELNFEKSTLYHAVYEYVKQYMRQYDASHDFAHVQRVLALAKYILAEEVATQLDQVFDRQAVILAALLHDVGDKKYLKPGDNPKDAVQQLLLENVCPPDLAKRVAIIVDNVSYSSEIKRLDHVIDAIRQHPELAIVQDADRLDALGAIGVGRAFAFGAVKVPDRGMQGSVDHFGEKLEKLESMMKTNTGKKLARERTQRLTEFKKWWMEEQSFAS